jgi:hypothetical protein
LPLFKSVDVNVDIDRFDINIKIYGNFWSELASAFEVFFVGAVADSIDSAITTALSVTLPNTFNALVRKGDGYLKIPTIANWVLDLMPETKYQVTSTYFGFDAKGLFFDSREGEIEPEQTIPVMPTKMTDHPEKF